jgi:hypothetical protein
VRQIRHLQILQVLHQVALVVAVQDMPQVILELVQPQVDLPGTMLELVVG